MNNKSIVYVRLLFRYLKQSSSATHNLHENTKYRTISKYPKSWYNDL